MLHPTSAFLLKGEGLIPHILAVLAKIRSVTNANAFLVYIFAPSITQTAMLRKLSTAQWCIAHALCSGIFSKKFL